MFVKFSSTVAFLCAQLRPGAASRRGVGCEAQWSVDWTGGLAAEEGETDGVTVEEGETDGVTAEEGETDGDRGR